MTFARTDHPDKSITYRREDGLAVVRVIRDGSDWRMEAYESDGIGSAELNYIGSEGPFYSRGGANGTARSWMRRLAKPLPM